MNHIEPNETQRKLNEMTQFLHDLVEYAKRLRKFYELDKAGLIDADTPKPSPPVPGQPF